MNPRILLISTYPELTIMAKQLSKELNIPIHVREGGLLRGCLPYIKKTMNQFDVIISHGMTASAISSMVDVPVIAMEIGTGNLPQAIEEAKNYGNPLALFASYKYNDLSELENLMRLSGVSKYKIFSYTTKSEFAKELSKAAKLSESYTFLCVGSCIQKIIEQNNHKCVTIKCSKKAVNNAIVSAQNILNASKKEKLRSEKLSSIIDYSHEAIIFIDKDGLIVTFNSVAEKILNIKPQNIFNKDIFNSSLPDYFKKIYKKGISEINKLIKLHNATILCSVVPLNLNAENCGTLINFQEISSIQKTEQIVRMKLHSKGLVAKYKFENIIGTSKSLNDTITQAIKFSKTSATILIAGETGTGKELFAQSIHNASSRKDGPFVAINCAAIPDNLLESELFGYEDGAFTGARKGGKPGLFELAHNGTIFLDEIGEISPSLQSRLLRVIQEKEFLRIGGDQVIKIDVRMIFATNKNLYKMVLDGAFRNDLYFRISVLDLNIAPLRERKEDIPTLVEHFLRNINEKYGTRIETISKQGVQLLQEYSWPGNIRELEVFIEKLILLNSEVSRIDQNMLEPFINDHMIHRMVEPNNNKNSIMVNVDNLKNMEKQIIETLLEKCEGNQNLLAKELGVSRVTIWHKLNESKQKSIQDSVQ